MGASCKDPVRYPMADAASRKSSRQSAGAKRSRLTKCVSVAILLALHGAESLRWTWDDNKNRVNKQKHGLGFETARLVFDDPLMAQRPDPNPDEDRWHTIGMIGGVIVAHTWPKPEHGTSLEAGRIISARKATAHERRAYEEGDS